MKDMLKRKNELYRQLPASLTMLRLFKIQNEHNMKKIILTLKLPLVSSNGQKCYNI